MELKQIVKSIFGLVFIVLAGIVGVNVVLHKNSLASTKPGNRIVSQARANRIQADVTPAPTQTAVSSEKKSALNDELPSMETYRTEVQGNPHQSPASFRAFAEKMAGKMDKAKTDKTFADSLLKQLFNCAHAEGVENPVKVLQAYCASNAKRLAKFYPEYKSDVASEIKQLPEAVRNLVN